MVDKPTSVSKSDRGELESVVRRLRSVVACSPELVRRVEALSARVESLSTGAVIQAEGAPIRRPRYLVFGWACRHRLLSDGRRQIFDVVLPGEGVGVCLRPQPLANTSTSALTPVRLADAGALLRPEVFDACPELERALHAQAEADERGMLNQIVRLGRMTAMERLAHLFLGLHARLAVIGAADGHRFPLPLTQETMADMTGLSVVHVNRTLQELRRQNLLQLERGWMRFLNYAALAALANYDPPPAQASRVTDAQGQP